MDLETAGSEVDTSMSRRSLVTRTGAAGLAGIAAALVFDRTASANVEDPTENERPSSPTSSDIDTLRQVMEIETAASRLYMARSDAGAGELEAAVTVMAENHQAFAQAIAGAAGISADQANQDVLNSNESGFTGSMDEFLTAAHGLEQQLAATHTELIAGYVSEDAIEITASVAITEVRHATVLADVLGVEDLDTLFGNDASPISLQGATS